MLDRADGGGPGSARHGDFWAITAYFNPLRFRTRRENYRTFRERLGLPLVTAELVFDGRPELGPGDAERWVAVRGGDVLWQKERLLNLALAALPRSCRYVAWIDCDLVFEDARWVERARAALDRVALLQPHETVVDLAAGASPDAFRANQVLLERPSMGHVAAQGALDEARTGASMIGAYSPGHVWCARRDVLDATRFYEHMVLGSGDFVMAMAAVGRQDRIPDPYGMNRAQTEHYRDWADRFHVAVGGAIGVVPGRIVHLWHGDLADRRYETRYAGLAAHAFDPVADVRASQGGALRWATDKPELHAYVRDYFARRFEDGRDARHTR